MEQGHDLSTRSSGCAEQAARVPGHAQSCLLWGGKAISLFIYPGKTSAGNKEQREEVFGAAEGPALKSEQGQRLVAAELQRSARSLWGGRSSREGAAATSTSPSVPAATAETGQEPASSLGPAKSHTGAGAAGQQPAASAPCRGAQGSTCPPGSPGPRCGNQVSTGPPDCPGGSPLLCCSLLGTGCFIPRGCSALFPQVTWDPGLFEISCYFNISVTG